MSVSLYLINPRSDFGAYYSADIYERLGLAPAAFVTDLSVATVAALAPDDFQVRICEESVMPVDFESDADFIGITGKSSQRTGMLRLAREFRKRGKTVIIGGPYVTLSPEQLREHCDILVRGELESIAERFFEDLRNGGYADDYYGEAADLSDSPPPRWDLYPVDRALQGCVQTSRGCPFICDFCDTIQYVGRRQRHKPAAQVTAELDALYELGLRTVFLADDNFTAHRPKARELLTALGDWQATRTQGKVRFSTQLSMDAAGHEDILRLCARAGLYEAFVGIETPNEESLLACGKKQNLRADLTQRLETFVSHGIDVIGGLMVGFDSDGPDIFEHQYAFCMGTPVPTFSLNALNAPPTTPLFNRLKSEQRLLDLDEASQAMTPWWTNLRPAQMSVGDLETGLKWLINRLYAPRAFEQRMSRFIECFDTQLEQDPGSGSRRAVNIQGVSVVKAIRDLGERESAMMTRLSQAARAKPATQEHLFANLFRYMQIRKLYTDAGCWDPLMAANDSPWQQVQAV